MVLDHAPLLHAAGLPGLANLDRQRDLLVAANGQEVDVDVPAVDVVALDLPWDGQMGRPVHLEIDQHRGPALMEQMQEILPGQLQEDRLHTVAVEDPRDPAGRPELAGGALPGAASLLGLEDGFHVVRPFFRSGEEIWERRGW